MNSLQTHLFKVGLQIFEDLGFLLPSSNLDEEQANAELEAAVVVEFSGPTKGMLLLSLSGQVLPGLTSNMLGDDNPVTTEQQLDALKEVANVVCGNLLPFMGSPGDVFDIKPPQICDPAALKRESGDKQVIHQAIGLENGRADIHLFLPEERLHQENK